MPTISAASNPIELNDYSPCGAARRPRKLTLFRHFEELVQDIALGPQEWPLRNCRHYHLVFLGGHEDRWAPVFLSLLELAKSFTPHHALWYQTRPNADHHKPQFMGLGNKGFQA